MYSWNRPGARVSVRSTHRRGEPLHVDTEISESRQGYACSGIHADGSLKQKRCSPRTAGSMIWLVTVLARMQCEPLNKLCSP